ncbi:hypothetical protein D1872_35960 [compost metagenome]
MFYNPMQTATIDSLVKFGKNLEYSHDKLHVKSKFDSGDDTIILNYSSILDSYYYLIKKNTHIKTLTNKEQRLFRFQPKRLSIELYETPELWSSILRINNLTSATQFDLVDVRVFDDNIFDILDEINILESKNMKKNKDLIYKK